MPTSSNETRSNTKRNRFIEGVKKAARPYEENIGFTQVLLNRLDATHYYHPGIPPPDSSRTTYRRAARGPECAPSVVNNALN